MVVVGKPSRGLRIFLGSRDLNKAIKREYYQLTTFEEIASRLVELNCLQSWMQTKDTGRYHLMKKASDW